MDVTDDGSSGDMLKRMLLQEWKNSVVSASGRYFFSSSTTSTNVMSYNEKQSYLELMY